MVFVLIVGIVVLSLWALIEVYDYFEDEHRWENQAHRIERTIDKIIDKFDWEGDSQLLKVNI
jgi:hypothetical protein